MPCPLEGSLFSRVVWDDRFDAVDLEDGTRRHAMCMVLFEAFDGSIVILVRAGSDLWRCGLRDGKSQVHGWFGGKDI